MSTDSGVLLSMLKCPYRVGANHQISGVQIETQGRCCSFDLNSEKCSRTFHAFKHSCKLWPIADGDAG